LVLGGELAVLQAPMLDGLSLDPFALFDDGGCPAEVGVGGCHVGQALVVTLVIVVLDEGLDLGFEVAGQEVILQQDAVLQGLMPALDLALGLLAPVAALRDMTGNARNHHASKPRHGPTQRLACPRVK
jgi:hypothetical protein